MAKHIPCNITDAEFFNYYMDSASYADIRARVERIVNELDQLKLSETLLETYYESAMEQSGFRRDAIEQILEFCTDAEPARSRETRELIARIRLHIENSYVEL